MLFQWSTKGNCYGIHNCCKKKCISYIPTSKFYGHKKTILAGNVIDLNDVTLLKNVLTSMSTT